METHAHLLISPSIEASNLPDELKKEGADTAHLAKSSFGIDDARLLTKMSASRGWENGRHFVVFAESMTEEAQNALLKLFEEPPQDTVFYLVIPSPSILLPTLQSRLISAKRGISDQENSLTDEFIKMSYGERLDLIAKLAKKDSDSLKRLVIDLGKVDIKDKKTKQSLLLATKYISNRGASKKMLVEELALSLPSL